MCVVASIMWKLMRCEVLYTTCIPNLGFILARVTSLVKKIVNLQMKSPLNV
jgi:hypothetical protein